MNVVLEFVLTILKILFYTLEGVIFFFVPRPKKEVKGQIALVTGSGSGLGKLLSIRLAKLGCILVLVDINEKDNEKTAVDVQKEGGHCYTITCDLSKRLAVNELVKKVKKEIGEVDILVNNAGIVYAKSLLDLTDEQIEKTFQVNVLAHFWLVRGFLESMMRRNQGHIISIASLAGYFSLNRLSDYCSSKSAAISFDEAVRVEMATAEKFGVKTTCICPYFINTGMFEGAKPRFPLLTPILEQDYVADKTIQAFLTDQRILLLPRLMNFLVVIKNLFPAKVGEALNEFFRTGKDLQDFTGRLKNVGGKGEGLMHK